MDLNYHKLILTFIGSVDWMDKRIDLNVCKKESREGFFLGLTSVNSSVIWEAVNISYHVTDAVYLQF